MIQRNEIKVEPIISCASVEAQVISVPPLLWQALPAEEKDLEEIIKKSLPSCRLLMPRQTHTLNVAVAENPDEDFPETDALVTFKHGLMIGVRTADCVPIVIWAPDVEGVAAVHAGWKGTLGGIVDNTLDILESRGGSPEKMTVAFGPSIGVDRYEVDPELALRFIEEGFRECVSYPAGENCRPHLDLQKVNALRLIRRGVLKENIILNRQCTFESVFPDGTPRYPCYRREGAEAGRLVTSIIMH